MPLVFSVRLQATTKPEPQSNEQEATNFLRWTVADFHTKNSVQDSSGPANKINRRA
ncbi:hypothetical protein PC128_g27618 [Phytophthora cactorum]|nr:hypothetical protein C6341_g27002 [Phytophthora cactorum]KAG3123487.1 hypothetical protein PC128_g27618 [Phytophthora cactorum]